MEVLNMKRLGIFALVVLMAAMPACGKKAEEKKPASKITVNTPKEVQGKWKAVVLIAEDKNDKSQKEFTVNLGAKATVPGSHTMTVEVKDFFPSFEMQGTTVTSSSNTEDNPAVNVVVSESGQEIFAGWLFGKYPSTHAFAHPKYAILLKEGIPN